MSSKDEIALDQLRESWRHFDAVAVSARQDGLATEAFAEACREFTSATIKLKLEFVALRKRQAAERGEVAQLDEANKPLGFGR